MCVYYYFCTTTLLSRITAVCAKALPFKEALVPSVIPVFESIIPSKWAVVPIVTVPATCQKMFLACAPLLKVMLTAELNVRLPATWKIQTSFGPPEIVTLEGTVTALDHLYKPGVS